MLGLMMAKNSEFYGSRLRTDSYPLVGLCSYGSLDPSLTFVSSVYTLWRHPQILPLLHTPEFVLQKLRSGAPLMTPGLARGPPFPTKAVKDAIVAIASLERPTVPIVVGVCEIDVANLQQVQGAKGHAVRGEHWEGDELWAWSSSGRPGGSAPEMIDGWDFHNSHVDLRESLEDMALDDQEDADEGGVPLPNMEEGPRSRPQNEYVDGEDLNPCQERSEDDKGLSTKGKVLLTRLLVGIVH